MKTSGYEPNSHSRLTISLWVNMRPNLVSKSGYKALERQILPKVVADLPLAKAQHGSLKNKNTTSALLPLIHKVVEGVNQKKTSLSHTLYGHWIFKSHWCREPTKLFTAQSKNCMLLIQMRDSGLPRSASQSTTRLLHITPPHQFLCFHIPKLLWTSVIQCRWRACSSVFGKLS